MAILQTAPNTLKVGFTGHWTNGEPMTNTMHFVYSSGADIDSEQAIAVVEDVRDVWQDEIMTLVANNYTFDSASYLDMSTVTGVTGSVPANTSLPLTGTGTGEALPPSCCTLVKKAIASSGRGKKPGRMYLPCAGEAQVTEDGLLVPASLTTINAALASALSTWNAVVVPGGDTIIAAVPHFRAADKPEDVEGDQVVWPAESVSFITSLTGDPKIGTQRRRIR